MTDAFSEARTSQGALAGATVLQIVPTLREDASARTAISIAYALLQAGARALVAAAPGPLVEELRGYGGEWISLDTETTKTSRRNVRLLENLIGFQRVDIIHAQCVGGAEAAFGAASKIAVWLVTTLPDVPPASSREFSRVIALARGHHIIAPSVYAAIPATEHYGIPRSQITIIPHPIDTALFNPEAVSAGRVDSLRRAWHIAPRDRVVLTPGRVAPWNGQILLPDVARTLADRGYRGTVFVIVGENRSYRRYARSVFELANSLGVDGMFRITGHCRDLPAALALADIVAVTAIEPPPLGSAPAQAQAMGRPVVTSDVGVLREQVVVPPHLPADVRTGWVAAPNDSSDFARALARALSLERTAYQAMSARAREFAEYTFSPASVAEATLGVYASLLSRNA